MSRHPSPGPSHPPSAPQPPRQKQQKAYSVGIAAGAEDVKYQAKYKELKRTVKEIEADNDKLHFKVLQAKRNIQRMKLERAILYEHMSAAPPSPEMRDRNPPPIVHTGPGVPPGPPRTHHGSHNREARDHSLPRESDHPMHDYNRVHNTVAQSPDVRPVSTLDTPIGPGAHSLSAMHSPRRMGSTGHEPRHLPPPLSQLPPVQQYDGSRGHSHPHSHASPPLHHTHPASHERSHSYSSRRGPTPSQSYPGQAHPQQPYPDTGAPLSHSPALSERERSRHHDVHDLPPSHARSVHQQSPHPSSDSRSSGRVHGHQRLGPGTYVNRDDPYDRGRDPERDRDWDRSRDVGRGHPMHSPPPVHRSRDYHDQPHSVSSRNREDGYYHDVPPSSGYPRVSRSGTPGSGSGSNSGIGVADVPSRPDSRAQYSEHERTRSYKLRPVNHSANEEMDFVHEDGRSHSRDRVGVSTTPGSGNNGNSANGTGGGGGNGNSSNSYGQPHAVIESRKRSRNEMEVDVENDVGEVGGGGGGPGVVSAGSGGPGTGTGYPSGGRLPEDRSSKRYHREQPPSHHTRSTSSGMEIQDEDRIGPQ